MKSIGYKTLPIKGVPFNEKTCTIPHDLGKVIDNSGNVVNGLYVCGWAKRGPVGIIDATLRDSIETFLSIKFHLESNLLQSKSNSAERTIQKIKK